MAIAPRFATTHFCERPVAKTRREAPRGQWEPYRRQCVVFDWTRFLAGVQRPGAGEGRIREPSCRASAVSARRPLRILVVEDEAVIAIMIEDMLVDLGCEVVGPAGSVAEAIRLAESEPLSGAFLDVNLGGASIYPVADLLSARRIPFVFVSGYGAGAIAARFAGTPILSKPILDADFEHALERIRQAVDG